MEEKKTENKEEKREGRKEEGKGAGGLRRAAVAALVLVMAVSGFMVAKEYLDGERKKSADRDLAEQVVRTTESAEETSETPGEETPYVSPIDFGTLLAKNPDTIGWITIPDTNVNYPIVQADDNDRYLHTDFDGRESIEGSIYLDFESDRDLMGRNNILYGHNMRNGSMFKDVVKYKDPAFFKDHQYFTIYTPEREIRLKAVAAYYEKAMPIMRKTRFKTRESYDAFIQTMLAPCAYAEIPEVPIDSLYLLITCSYEVNDARTYLFAVPVDADGQVIASEDPEAGFYPDEAEGVPQEGPAGGACAPEPADDGAQDAADGSGPNAPDGQSDAGGDPAAAKATAGGIQAE